MNAKKLLMKMAAAFVAAAVFSSTAVAVSANAENSVYYWGTYKDEKKVSLQVDETYQLDLGDCFCFINRPGHCQEARNL